MDSSNGQANYKLEAIRIAIANGKLTKEDINKRLTNAISKEYEKPPKERNGELITAFGLILYEMNIGKPYVSRKEEVQRAFMERLEKENNRHKLVRRVVWRGLAAVCAIALLFFGLEALLHREGLQGDQSPDEQQYVISGQEIDPGLIDEGQADNAGQSQTITTTDLNKAVSVLGYTPLMPTWVPDGWTVETYYVNSVPGMTTFRIRYENQQQDFLLRFNMNIYPDAEVTLAEFEQAKSGEEVECNGWVVYMAQNVDRCVVVWHVDTICYSLSGHVTSDEMLKIIESIQRSD